MADDQRTYRPDELERSVLQFWREHDTFRRSVTNRRGKPPFVFLEGPPTANGLPHAGHVLTRTLKDAVCRYKTMRGHYVERKGGWDCHGLPVEIEVEKELGLKNKQDIERYGVAKFNQKCRESVFRYKKEWEEMVERVGHWIDLEHPYVTLTNEYIESVWWSLQQAWKKGLLSKGFRVSPYCARCGTALSSHEVAQGYRDVEEPSLFIKFRLDGKPHEYILAWTTTPWTLPGNVALAVGKDIDYVTVEQQTEKGPERYVLARACLGVLRGEYKIVAEFKGEKLRGAKYEPLFPFLQTLPEFAPGAKAWFVETADFVTTEDGTGVVHTSVMYGEDDYEFGVQHGIPQKHTVQPDGRFAPFAKDYAGLWVKDADPKIIEDLRTKGLLYRVKVHKHIYPFCWRCKTPLLYYARDQWFIRMSQLRENLVRHNATVNWYPEHMKEGRFGDFIANVKDWALSRERYWGTPLPVWTCPSCKHQECVGSIEALAKLGGETVRRLVAAKKLDLHKPAVDEIDVQCPNCGTSMQRDPSVIDTWYDSGSAHFAQWHYPFENRDLIDVVSPADFVTEGLDQTRGWFYTLLATSTILFDRPAFRNCLVSGLILDEKGQKMSKSRRNYTDPHVIFRKYGADAMRWYLLSSGSVTADKRFFDAAIHDTHARMFLTLWNAAQFLFSYAALDGWRPGTPPPPFAGRPLLDRWLLTRLQTVTGVAVREADAYNIHKATAAIQDFLVDDLSNWWLRRSRRRFWSEERSAEKAAAYATLHEALLSIATLAAPFAPFLAEHLFQRLRLASMPESVHFANYPPGIPAPQPIEGAMDEIRNITEATRRLRDQAHIKTRVPLPRLTLVRPAPDEQIQQLLELVREEANVKEVRIVQTAEGLEDYEAKINQQAVGRAFKNDAKPILEAARQVDPKRLGRELATAGRTTLAGKELGVQFFNIGTVASEGTLKADLPRGGVAILDAHLTPELEAEGWARELVRRIQEMRKEARLELEDLIHTRIQAPEAVARHAATWGEYIRRETRSKEIQFDGRAGAEGALVKDWDIEGEKVRISIAKAKP